MFDTLQNFAEVGVAIAGFSGIASAVSARSLQEWTPVERDHLIGLLETSGLVVVFALVPQVLLQLVEEAHALWVVSSLLYLVVHVLHYGITGRKMLRSISAGRGDAIRLRTVFAMGAVATILLVSQATAILFGTTAQLKFIYLVILLWHTAIAGAMFADLLTRSVARHK